MKYYEKKDFARSIALFEDILPIIRGTKEAESANFYYAYAHFYQDLFILSAHYFETFIEIYSRSNLAIEANYMFGYSFLSCVFGGPKKTWKISLALFLSLISLLQLHNFLL